MTTRLDIPRYQIRQIVGALHVGKSDEYVKAEIRERATRAGWLEPDIVRAEQYAIRCHRQNQRLYSAVMTGRV